MTKDIPSLYIHIPFCREICDYCDFPKLQYFRFIAEKYLLVLKEEMELYAPFRNLKTIYIGGGTPTALDDDLFEQLLKMVSPYSKGVDEYTIEANPESLSRIKLQLMKKYGVNRLSIGVESTDNKILKIINRHHTYEDVIIAIKNANEVGFNNINVDLILGLPHVSKKQINQDIKNLLTLNIKHISCYSLTVHPHTKFYLNNVLEPDDDLVRSLYDIVDHELTSNGFIHYEVSNFAQPGYMSKHNLNYWKNKHYYGLGLGAASFINHYRYTNTRNINAYNKFNFKKEKEYVDDKNDEHYFLMLNLRTIEGIDLNEYQRLYSIDFLTKYGKVLRPYIENGYLIYQKETQAIYPSHSGMMILDTILVDLFAN